MIAQLRGAGLTEVCPRCESPVIRGRGTLADPVEAARLHCLRCAWHRYMLPVLPAAALRVAEPREVWLPFAVPGLCAGCGNPLPLKTGSGRRSKFCSQACRQARMEAA